MFRNPRENASRVPTELLVPSVGRPPSPPTNLQPPRTPNASMATKTASLVPAVGRQAVAQPTPKRNPTAGARTPKVATKSNASILSFFKKAESRDTFEPLFFQDRSGVDSSHNYGIQRVEDDTDLDGLYTDDGPPSMEPSRFNESTGSNKRRRTSQPPLLEVQTGAQEDLAGADKGPEDKPRARSDRDTVKRAAGPFMDDSDDATDADEENTAHTDNGNATKSPRDEQLATEEVYMDSGRQITPKSGAREDGTAAPPPDDVLVVGLKREPSEDAQELLDGMEPPSLKREATSYGEMDGFDDFEGMGDFEDENPEGEEFVERKWMQEQRKLEIEAGTFEGGDFEGGNFERGDFEGGAFEGGDFEGGDFDGDDENSHKESTKQALVEEPGGDLEATCPVCAASFKGVSDQEASVHVNHCLDGNPTPLPTAAVKDEDGHPETKGQTSSMFRRQTRPVRPAKPGQENPFQLGKPASSTSSAFSKIMSGRAEDAAWATAAAEQNATRGKPAYQRTCPFYKILPGLYICVDAFRYGAVKGCSAYFLSHFHSDHYVGLTSTWSHGPIYCSRVTAALVRQQLRVDPKYVVDLEFDQTFDVPGTQGVSVTMIPANHCPGSSLYLFEKTTATVGKPPRTQRILHCGDFRACPAHVEHPLLRPDVRDAVTGATREQKIDVCYLDTTYLSPRYAFPSQEDVIQACADMCVSLSKPAPDPTDAWAQSQAARAGNLATFVTPAAPTPAAAAPAHKGRLLVVVGTYSIGKERICLGIARALNSLIYAPAGKQRICAALADPELTRLLTTNPAAAQVHMTPLFEIRAETLADYLAAHSAHFGRVVGFRPSGWMYRPPGARNTDSPSVDAVLRSRGWQSGFGARDLVPQRGSGARSACFGVPYSEHSSFRELTMFCCALRIERVIPTVNVGSAKGRERMRAWTDKWAAERRKNGLFRFRGRDEAPGDGADGKGEWYAGKGTWDLRTTL